MSPKILSSTLGLAAFGLFWCVQARAQDPANPPAELPASARPGAGAPAAASPTVHLLSHGRVLKGALSEYDADTYSIRQKLGSFRFAKTDLVRSFADMESLYAFRREQFPANDPDEHMKLARWCLSEKLLGQTRRELSDVLVIEPNHAEARAMLEKLDLEVERDRARDPEVRVASAAPADLAPTSPEPARTLDPIAQQSARRDLGISDVPVIFNLPSQLAVKRAQEFGYYVHPILQQKCARCHNEKYDGKFRMIQVFGKRGLKGDVLRVNLDATLQLIDPDSPEKSELLTGALMPHKSMKRSVMVGQNDPEYRILATWVQRVTAGNPPISTKPPANLEPTPGDAQAERAPRSASSGATAMRSPRGFAADRAPKPRPEPPGLLEDAMRDGQVAPASGEAPAPEAIPDAPGRMIPGSYSGLPPLPSSTTVFPSNDEATDELVRSFRESQAKRAQGAQPEKPAMPPLPSLPAPGGATQGARPKAAAPAAKSTAKKPDAKTAPASKKKEVKIDLDALGDLMSTRNGKRPQ